MGSLLDAFMDQEREEEDQRRRCAITKLASTIATSSIDDYEMLVWLMKSELPVV